MTTISDVLMGVGLGVVFIGFFTLVILGGVHLIDALMAIPAVNRPPLNYEPDPTGHHEGEP